ncbi:MAG: glycosyltransferase, partial [Gemmatimonadales bacterium]|nr:glycosyltransferase [Gemmatimonadales bacterium]
MGTDAAVTGAGGARCKRILQVTAPARVGGLERVVQALAIGQQAAGHPVMVAMVVEEGQADHPFQKPLIDAGVDVAPILVPTRQYHVEGRLVAELCRRFHPEIVHCHGTRANVIDGMTVRHLGLPAVATAHGFVADDLKYHVYELLDRFLMRRFDAVISVSAPLAATLRRSGVRRDRIHVIPNAWLPIADPYTRGAAR